jgi:glycosyltransferase involved in cell wall biosynthesis
VRIQEPFVTGELLDDLMEQSIVEDRFREIEPPANLLRIQAVLAHPGLVSSLQSAQQMTFQNVLLRLQAAEGADAHAPSTLRQLRQLLVYELFHHETALARVEDAAAHLPPNPMADVISEVLTSEKCDTLLAYWVGLHLEAMHRPGEAMRAFNRSLLNSQASFLPAQYIARAALKAANLALQLDQTLLAEKTLREIVLKLQPSSPQAHAMLEKIAGKTGSAPSPKPNPPAPVAAPARHDSTAPAQPAKTPLVSAIVSTYKSEKFMRGCLEDLEAQTIAGELEIIVIDSCSPQNERAIVEEFQKNFPNIVYIRSGERETLSGAWNRAIKAARGKYITTANTDDRHRRDALETLSRTLDGNPDITLAYADCLITQIENETFESTKATRKFQWLDFSAQDLLLKGCFCGPQPMWRREVHDEHGYFDAEFVSAGDYEFWLKIARTRKFLHVKELLGLYLESPASVEHSNPELGAWETREAQRRYGPEILPGYGIDNMPPRPPSTHVQSAPPQRVTSIVIPPCGLAGNLTPARDLLDKKQHRAAWEAAIAAINVRPFHPEAHLLLAKIALAAGAGDASRQCAQRARQLAPEWSPARKFLKGNLRGQMKPKWLTAPPATPPAPRLSVCLIVKNEEQFLGQCLQSVRGIARQIVVLDTGSTDRTVAIAKEHGAEVFHFAWSDDFSAARNEALKYATGDWVLCLDADEELLPEHQRTILEEMGSPGVMGYRLPIINEGQEQEGCSYVPRLFRNAPGLFFVGRVHEQVFSSLVVRAKEWGLENRLGRAALLHHGYRKEVADSRGKAARNLRLLQLAIKELPGEPNLVMNLGLELVRSGQLEAGLEQYREALRLMSALPSGQVVPELRETLLTQLTTHLLRAGRFGEIVELWRQPFPQSSALTASQHFMLGLAQMELKQPAAAAEQMRQCLAKRRQPALSPINKEILKAGPHHCLALSLAALGQQAEAEQAFRDALGEDAKLRPVRFDFAKFQFQQGRPLEALKLANELVAESCQDVQTWLLGGQIALSQPDFLEFAQDWTGEAMKHFPEDSAILLQRAEALTLNQQAALALPLWTKAHSPDSARHLAALTLCELLAGECRRRFAPPTEPMVSQEFLKWYRRLIKFKARSVVNNINEKLDDLQAVLPGVVKVLGAAMKQAEATMAV